MTPRDRFRTQLLLDQIVGVEAGQTRVVSVSPAPEDRWGWEVLEFTLGTGWTIGLSLDGQGFESADYIDFARAPSGWEWEPETLWNDPDSDFVGTEHGYLLHGRQWTRGRWMAEAGEEP